MEQTIETLLNDFEQGRMNRRQLIKHIAMLAAVAAPATAAAQSAPAKAPWTTVPSSAGRAPCSASKSREAPRT